MNVSVEVDDSGSDTPLMGFLAEYTAKDLILYALAVGFGSSENDQQDELQYLVEFHPSFCAVPSFPLVLPFWADRPVGTSHGIKTFPPPIMKAMGVLLKKFLRVKVPENLPVIHISQSITWNRAIHVPKMTDNKSIQTNFSSRCLSVAPKSVGTFVTNETKIMSSGSVICTLKTTSLVLGMSPQDVIPYGKMRKRERHSIGNRTPVFEWTYKTIPTQALLYRMASGDSNGIHVDSSSVSLVGASKRPLLHGLCTLGIAVRGIMKYLRKSEGYFQFTLLESDFTRPVHVGDCLIVRIWEDVSHDKIISPKRIIFFKVLNTDSGEVVIDHGMVTVKQTPGDNSGQIRARL